MPPSAAATGIAALAGLDKPPSSNSRLISRPTKKKNTAIRPSLTHNSRGLAICSEPAWTATGRWRNAS